MIDSLKKEIDKYIAENGGLKSTIAGLEKETNSIRGQLKEHNSANIKKESLIKDIEKDFQHQKTRISELEAEIKSKNLEIIEMARFSELGKKFERIKETEGDCTMMGKREMDQMKERLNHLFKENKVQEETIKKKNAKIVEVSEALDNLQTDLAKLNKDLSSRNTEIDKLLQKNREIELEKGKLNSTITNLTSEIKGLKDKIEKIQEDSKRKLKELEQKSKKSDGLGTEIQSLKEQLDQKIKMMNSLSNKNANLGDSEARLKEEIKKSESLVKMNQDINSKLSQSEESISGMREELRLKEIEIDFLKRNSSQQSSIAEIQLSQLRDEVQKLKSDLHTAIDERDKLQESSKSASITLMETSSKLKGALLRLEEAEKTLSKYDIPALEKKMQDLQMKGEAIGKAAERIKTAMNTLKIAVICRKCNNFPTDGKTYFPCGHCYCSACDQPSSNTCSDCKKAVESKISNPLINDVKMNYGYMNDLVGFMIETSLVFAKS